MKNRKGHATAVAPSRTSPRLDRLALFSVAWSAFLIIHMGLTPWKWMQSYEPAAMVLGVLSFVLAVGLALRPWRTRRLLASAAVFLVYQLYSLPWLPNHIFVGLFLQAGLVVLGVATWRRFGGDLDSPRARRRIHRQFAALVLATLPIVYGYAVFQKLNHDYFNPEHSAAVVLLIDICEATPLLTFHDAMRWPSIVGSLVMEAAIPVLLLLRRTRTLAIVVALLFHLVLSLHPEPNVVSFSAMVWAMYALFVPRRWIRGLRRVATAPWLPSWTRMVTALCVVGMVIGVSMVGMWVGGAPWRDLWATRMAVRELAPILTKAVWLAWAAVVLAMVARLAITSPAANAAQLPAMRMLRAMPRPLWIIPLILVLNGLCPYVGLKTTTAFSMFSNLRTEQRQTNHLFMPVSLQLTDYPSDLVELVNSDHPRLQQAIAHGDWLTTFEVRRCVRHSLLPWTQIVVRRDGVVATIRHDGDASTIDQAGFDDLLRPVPWVARWLMVFRPVTPLDRPMRASP